MQGVMSKRYLTANQVDSKYDLSSTAKAHLYATAVLLSVSLIVVTAYKVNKFFALNQLMIRSPVILRIQSPIFFIPRRPQIMIRSIGNSGNSPLTPDQRYLCDKFGKDCAIALAIFRAESHYNPKALHINKNNTVDIGCMQINSVHLAKINTSNVNLLNCRDNIDVAYTIYKQWKGFGAWRAYTNGSYRQYSAVRGVSDGPGKSLQR
jgi:hypothetical protein